MTEWLAVEGSTSIEAVAYDEEAQRILVRFSGGAEYWYAECSEAVWDELLTATSKGRYVNQELKRRPFGRVRG